ncbi:hypothetical protein J8273_5723 [Carpediemonas membranifera]|uniref:Uncharacterized protein n=1 Tax=Carpediemonas membranifera TaxID=201153 RepID=A0A8J6AS05_9EUKA|nr:hypothetical protein J8273_5723 [Carpediemonas membranifera]|eukprot:KAG9392911.1 hypothetical protein J8273_5723 [Carpediemonas membranifera]
MMIVGVPFYARCGAEVVNTKDLEVDPDEALVVDGEKVGDRGDGVACYFQDAETLCMRSCAFRRMGVGVSVWELGQGYGALVEALACDCDKL